MRPQPDWGELNMGYNKTHVLFVFATSKLLIFFFTEQTCSYLFMDLEPDWGQMTADVESFEARVSP